MKGMTKRKGNNGGNNGTGITKIPQPHGGALNSGGTPGHRGGSGRPPHSIKRRFRDLADLHGVKVLEDVMLDEDRPHPVHPNSLEPSHGDPPWCRVSQDQALDQYFVTAV